MHELPYDILKYSLLEFLINDKKVKFAELIAMKPVSTKPADRINNFLKFMECEAGKKYDSESQVKAYILEELKFTAANTK